MPKIRAECLPESEELRMTAATNIDDAEVARFARLSAQWWDPNGKFKPLHALAPARLRFIRDVVDTHFDGDFDARHPLKDKRVLDVGCGGGLVSEPLARMGGTVTAIDPSSENIGIARAHASETGVSVDYRAVTAESLVEAGETFDLVTCLEVIEHVPSPDSFVGTLSKLIKPDGCLILSTLNRTMKSYALAIVGAEYVLGWLERGTHDWNRFLTPDELADFAGAVNLEVFERSGIVFNPLTGVWTTSGDMDVNYMLAARPSPHSAGLSSTIGSAGE